jgi:glycerol-3-phosphate dehydrogenase (NAD(P)+)
MSAEEAQKEVNMVVEGVRTCRAAKELADRLGVEMPIVSEAYSVLYGDANVKDAMKSLMLREKKSEH